MCGVHEQAARYHIVHLLGQGVVSGQALGKLQNKKLDFNFQLACKALRHVTIYYIQTPEATIVKFLQLP
jgi:hypothetical protein